MLSLTARRAATEAIRAYARASLAAAQNPNSAKPTIRLFAAQRAAQPHQEQAAMAVGKETERYRWRCKVCHMFGRSFRPDKSMAAAAKQFAYDRRSMIHSAFDNGKLKSTVLERITSEFKEAAEAVTTAELQERQRGRG